MGVHEGLFPHPARRTQRVAAIYLREMLENEFAKGSLESILQPIRWKYCKPLFCADDFTAAII